MVDQMSAAPQLIEYFLADALLDADMLRIVAVRREEAGEVIGRKFRRLDRLLQRHPERHAIQDELQRPLLLLVAAHRAESHPRLAVPECKRRSKRRARPLE